MTLEEVTAGWICTAKDSLPKEIKKPIYPKRNRRLAMAEMLSKEIKDPAKIGIEVAKPISKNSMANMLSMIKKSSEKA